MNYSNSAPNSRRREEKKKTNLFNSGAYGTFWADIKVLIFDKFCSV